MNRKHIKTPEHMVTTMWEIYKAGYVAECTFRIDQTVLKEAMKELTEKRADGLEPDAIKIFPAGSHGPSGIKSLLAPYARERHSGRIIMPTGSVGYETSPKYQEAILANGFAPVLGMLAPLKLVEKKGKPGDIQTIRDSLSTFSQNFLASNYS